MGTSEGGSEDIFHALQEFCETPQSLRELSQPVEDALEHIAKTGELRYPWNLVRPVIELKLEKTFKEFFEATSFPDQSEAERNHNQLKNDIFSRLAYFDRAPFTVQRLCELVLWPKSHYTRCDKYMRGLTKVVKVVSTIGPICNGSSHTLPTKPCNGNGNSSALGRHESTATSGEASNMHLDSTSSMSGEDDTFSSFNLSPRQMPSPYSPPLSPSAYEGRNLDDRPTWRLSSGDEIETENGGERGGEDSNVTDADSDSSCNTQSTVELGDETIPSSQSPPPAGECTATTAELEVTNSSEVECEEVSQAHSTTGTDCTAEESTSDPTSSSPPSEETSHSSE